MKLTNLICEQANKLEFFDKDILELVKRGVETLTANKKFRVLKYEDPEFKETDDDLEILQFFGNNFIEVLIYVKTHDQTIFDFYFNVDAKAEVSITKKNLELFKHHELYKSRDETIAALTSFVDNLSKVCDFSDWLVDALLDFGPELKVSVSQFAQTRAGKFRSPINVVVDRRFSFD